MKIWKIIKNFITCKPKVKPIKISPVDEKELTKREEGKEIDKIPEDEFLCPKCDMIPEILEVNLDTGKLTMNCKNHGKITRFATKYIDELLNSYHTYLDNKCRYCNRKSKRSTIDKMKYCTICRQNICVECAANIDMEHQINNNFVPINEKKNLCKKNQKKAEKYCQDCEEIICDDDEEYHSEHSVIDTEDMQKEANKYRVKIADKIVNLLHLLKLYELVNKYGNKDAKKNFEEIINKEKKRNDNDVDLAIYYLDKQGEL